MVGKNIYNSFFASPPPPLLELSLKITQLKVYDYKQLQTTLGKLELESRMMSNHLARFKEHFIIL
jgi:hypothetical protein